MRPLFSHAPLALALLLTAVPDSRADDKKPMPSAETRRTFTDKLDAGRKATKDGRYDEACALFREALQALPGSSSALGELGWALFQAGKLDEAKVHTANAEYLATRPTQKAALLYNLGRIAEAQGQKEAAREHYSRSLILRENDTVRKRVEGLGGSVNIPPPIPEAKDKVQATAEKNAELPPLITSAVEFYCDPFRKGQEDAGECDHKVEKELKSAGTGITEARVTRVEGGANMGGSVDAQVLTVRVDGGPWFSLGVVADSWNPGFGYVQNNGEVTAIQVGELAPTHPGQELEFTTSNYQRDLDPGVERAYNNGDIHWNFCGTIAGAHRCLRLRVESESTTHHLDEWNEGKLLGSSGYVLDVKRTAEKVTIAKKSGKPGKDMKKCIGTFTLDQLAALPCTEVLLLQ